MLCFIDDYKVFLQHYLSGYNFFTRKKVMQAIQICLLQNKTSILFFRDGIYETSLGKARVDNRIRYIQQI